MPSSRTCIVVSPVANVPAFEGNCRRVSDVVAALRRIGFDVHFCLAPITPFPHAHDYDELARFWGDRFHVLNDRVLYPGGNLHRALKRVQSAAVRRAGRLWTPTLDRTLQALIDPDGYVSIEMVSDFERLVGALAPDLIVVEYVFLSTVVRSLQAPRPRTVVDTHDLFTDRNERMTAAGTPSNWLSLTRPQEADLLSRFDQVWAIQRHEQAMFERMPGVRSVVVLDILAPSSRAHPIAATRPLVGYIGSPNEHNRRGLLTFVQRHWPAIRRAQPDAKLAVAGATFDDLIGMEHAGIRQVGQTRDLGTFYDECAIVVNPCPSGTGLKMKSIEALGYGKPLVTTAHGLQGIEDAEDAGAIRADLDHGSFADACVLLLDAPARQLELGAAGIEYINTRYRASLDRMKRCLALP